MRERERERERENVCHTSAAARSSSAFLAASSAASRSSSACFAITNILRTDVELNVDRLDPSTGFAATLAARIVSGGRLIVVEISRLSAAGGAAHAGIAPMHRGHWRCT
jgi:hypothetical protein